MLERPRRRRLILAPAALAALALATGAPASASRAGKAEDAFAQAVAARVFDSAMVTAEARGDQTDQTSGASVSAGSSVTAATARSTAATQVRRDLRATAEARLAGADLRVPAELAAHATSRALAAAEPQVASALRTVCPLDVDVQAKLVAEVVVRAAVDAAVAVPFAQLEVDASFEAEVRAEIQAALSVGAGKSLLCDQDVSRLTRKVITAVHPVVARAAETRLSLSVTGLRSECDLSRRHGAAVTELLVHQRAATVAGLGGRVAGEGSVVSVPPNTTVDLGGDVVVVFNEQQRTNRAGREARIAVHGLVLRVGGTAVATLASSRCELRGDVRIDTAAESGPSLVVEPDVDNGAHVAVEARIEATVEAEVGVGRRSTGASLQVDAAIWAAGRL